MSFRVLRGDGPLVRIGHRGAAALAPANTIPAIEAALAAGVDIVELDIVAQPNGKLTLGHSLRELEAQPAGLDEAFALIARTANTGLLADIKRSGFESELLEALRRHKLVERALASSSDLPTLRSFRGIEPALARSRTYPRDRLGLGGRFPFVVGPASHVMRGALAWRIGRLLAEADATVATLQHRIVSRTVVDRCHARGAAVFAWTVNERHLLERLDTLGVDGVITDDPRIFEESSTGLDSKA
jgi:glycerophosphoryl diester phosphodiesterase